MNAITCLLLCAGALCATVAHADAVTDWNIKAGEAIVEARIGTPPAVRVMAIVQTAAHQAVQSASQRGSSIEAALAASHRVSLSRLLPAQQSMIDAAYQSALGAIASPSAMPRRKRC